MLQGLPLVNESGREDMGLSFHHKIVLRTHLCSMPLSLSTAVAILTQIIALDTVNAVVPLGTILEATGIISGYKTDQQLTSMVCRHPSHLKNTWYSSEGVLFLVNSLFRKSIVCLLSQQQSYDVGLLASGLVSKWAYLSCSILKAENQPIS